MNNIETGTNQPSPNKPTIQDCPSHLYSVRELRGYLRSRAEASIPIEVLEHLDNCSACESNWEFLNETDPLLARHREERFGLVLREVQAEPQRPILSQSAAFRMRAAVGSASGKRTQLINDLKEVLARTLKVPELEVFSLVREGSLEAKKIVEVCQNIGSIADDALRAQQATKIAGLFADRIEQKGNSEFFIGNLLSSPETTIDLSQLASESRVDLETSVAFVASIPHTSFITPPILEMEENGSVLFHTNRLKEALQQYGRGLLAGR